MKAVAKLKDDARKNEQAEQWEQAIEAYVEVLRLTDNAESELPLYNRIGDLYVRMGRPADAVTYYENAADHYAEAGLYNNAIALCNKAMRYVPNRLELLRKLGQFSAAQGFLTDARRWYLEYAERQLKQGALDDAFTALDDFATLYEDAEIRELLGRHLRTHNRIGPAVIALKRAHTLRVQAGEHAIAKALKAEILEFMPGAFSGEPESDEVAASTPVARAAPPAMRSPTALPGFGDAELEEATEEAFGAATETAPPVPPAEPARLVEPAPPPPPQYVAPIAEPEPPKVDFDQRLAEMALQGTRPPEPPVEPQDEPSYEDEEELVAEAAQDVADEYEENLDNELPLIEEESDDLPLIDDVDLPESTGNPFSLDFPPLGEALSLDSGVFPFLGLDQTGGKPSSDPFSLIDFDQPDTRSPGLVDLPEFEPTQQLEPIDLSAAFAAMPPPAPAAPVSPPPVPLPPVPPAPPAPLPPVSLPQVTLTPHASPPAPLPPVSPPPITPPAATPGDEWGDPPAWVSPTSPAGRQPPLPIEPLGASPDAPVFPPEPMLPKDPFFPPEAAWGEPIGFEAGEEDEGEQVLEEWERTSDFAAETVSEALPGLEPFDSEPELDDEPEPEPEPLPELPPPPVFRTVHSTSPISPPQPRAPEPVPAAKAPAEVAGPPEPRKVEPPAASPTPGQVEPPPRQVEPPPAPPPVRPVPQPVTASPVAATAPVPPAAQVGPYPETGPAAAPAPRSTAADFASVQQMIHGGDSAGAINRLQELHVEMALQGKFRDAWHACELLLQLDPGNLKALQQRVEYASSLGQRDLLVRSYLELARQLTENGAESKGAVIYQRVLDIDPYNEEAQSVVHSAELPPTTGGYVDLFTLISEEENEASTRFMVEEQPPTGDEERDFADMLAQFKQKVAAHLSIDDSNAHYDLGLAFKEMGLIDEAIAEFQTAMKGGGERLKVYEELGQCFLLKQQYNVAVNVLNRALQMPVRDDGDRVGVYYALGRSYEELGQNAHARAAYEHVIGLDINFQDASQRLAKL